MEKPQWGKLLHTLEEIKHKRRKEAWMINVREFEKIENLENLTFENSILTKLEKLTFGKINIWKILRFKKLQIKKIRNLAFEKLHLKEKLAFENLAITKIRR